MQEMQAAGRQKESKKALEERTALEAFRAASLRVKRGGGRSNLFFFLSHSCFVFLAFLFFIFCFMFFKFWFLCSVYSYGILIRFSS